MAWTANDMAKEALPYITIGTGSTMITLSPSVLLQFLGLVVGACGIYWARKRVLAQNRATDEARRANDINERRLEHDIAKSKDSEKAKPPD